MIETDFLIVGAGVVGLATARSLAKKFSDCKITIIEKEKTPASHASGRNSGVLHAGFYYPSDSLKAKFAAQGNRALTTYCLENGIPINQCGKVVVTQNRQELSGLFELKRRGDKNGVDLQLIDEKELNEIEPNAKTFEKALFSPATSSVNPKKVCRHLVSRFPGSVQVLYQRRLVGLKSNVALTTQEKIKFKHLYNAAGLYADQVARLFGVGRHYTVIPFKGIYLAYNDNALIEKHIYPVPNLKNPFLGVHFTKTVDHHVKIGPTAIPAFWLENYNFKNRFRMDEFLKIIAFQAKLFWLNNFNFRALALEEIKKYSRTYFINESAKLVKHLKPKSFGDYINPGIRAQLLNKRTGELEMDFVVEYKENSTHILNSVSPAFTTALTFTEFVVNESEKYFN